MKRFLKIIGIIFTVSITVLYLISCLTAYISSEWFSLLTIFSIGYLLILPVYVVTAVVWLFSKRKAGFLLLILTLAGYKNITSTVAFNILTAHHKNKPDSALRVMTWNVNEFVNDQIIADSPNNARRKIFKFIKEMQPDVLCIQDMVENSAPGYLSNIKELRDYLQYNNYHYSNYSRLSSGISNLYYGVAIFSKLPLADSGSVSLHSAGSLERIAYIDIHYQKKPLRIFTAHLSSMSLWPSDKPGVKYVVGDSTEIKLKSIFSKLRHYGKMHAQQAEIIRKTIDTTIIPKIFCGDLNSVPSSNVHQRIKGNLNDVFLERGFLFGGTYNRVFPKIRIDVVFHSDALLNVNYYRPELNYSDHLPIVADFKWKE